VPLRSSAQNQEFRPLSDEKPGSTFSESGRGRAIVAARLGADRLLRVREATFSIAERPMG